VFPLSEETDVLKLLHFDEAYLTPVRQRFRKARTNRARAFALGELLEAYFWLALGVEIGYYGESSTKLLAAARFVELLSESTEFFGTYGFLFAPDFELRIQTAKNQKQVLQKAEDYTFVNPTRFHSWFQRALGLEIESLHDRPLTALFATLAFLAPTEIEALLSVDRRTRHNEFSTYLSGPRLTNTFGISMSHLESFAVLDRDISSHSDENPEDSFFFRARIRQLTRWRLNLRSQTVKHFYQMISDWFFGSRIEGLGLSIDSFRDSLTNLLNEWGLTHESSLAAR